MKPEQTPVPWNLGNAVPIAPSPELLETLNGMPGMDAEWRSLIYAFLDAEYRQRRVLFATGNALPWVVTAHRLPPHNAPVIVTNAKEKGYPFWSGVFVNNSENSEPTIECAFGITYQVVPGELSVYVKC